MRLGGDVEAEACVRGKALGVHAVEDGDASVDVVVELDVMLSLMRAQESSDVLDDPALERQREGEEQRVELGPNEALPEVGAGGDKYDSGVGLARIGSAACDLAASPPDIPNRPTRPTEPAGWGSTGPQ